MPAKPVEVFISYSRDDLDHLKKLKINLASLKRSGDISVWHDREIVPGEEWERKINEHLESARIILLLVSASFVASDYCNDIEVKRAMERHKAGEAIVIPIILSPAMWENAPFAKLQALPQKNGIIKPVTKWGNRQEAYASITIAIKSTLGKKFGPTPPVPPTSPSPTPPTPPVGRLPPVKSKVRNIFNILAIIAAIVTITMGAIGLYRYLQKKDPIPPPPPLTIEIDVAICLSEKSTFVSGKVKWGSVPGVRRNSAALGESGVTDGYSFITLESGAEVPVSRAIRLYEKVIDGYSKGYWVDFRCPNVDGGQSVCESHKVLEHSDAGEEVKIPGRPIKLRDLRWLEFEGPLEDFDDFQTRTMQRCQR